MKGCAHWKSKDALLRRMLFVYELILPMTRLVTFAPEKSDGIMRPCPNGSTDLKASTNEKPNSAHQDAFGVTLNVSFTHC